MGGQVTYLMSVVLLLAGIAVPMFATTLIWTGIDFIEYWTSNPRRPCRLADGISCCHIATSDLPAIMNTTAVRPWILGLADGSEFVRQHFWVSTCRQGCSPSLTR